MKTLCGVMALYLFNISVDSPDGNLNHYPENLEVNDIESVVELVLEEFLSFNGAIAEYDDLDTEDQFKKKSIKIIISFSPQAECQVLPKPCAANKPKPPFALYQLSKGHSKLDVPPPKV